MKKHFNLLKTGVIIIVFSLLSAGTILAQNKMQDIIYLKNGSILHGTISEIKINESVTLLSNCGDTWVLKQSDIDRIEKVPLTRNQVKREMPQETKDYMQNRFYSGLQLGFLFGGEMETPFPALSLMFMNGYQFDFGLSAGVGLGIDLMSEISMPVVGELRYTFLKSKVSHFVFFQGGYSFALQDPDPYDYDYYDYYESNIDSKGGYILNPGIGYRINLNEKKAFLLNIGYKYMQIKHTYEEINGQTIDRTLKYNRVTFGFTYQF